MITLELPPQIQSTIEKESQQVGMSVEQYIISKLMPKQEIQDNFSEKHSAWEAGKHLFGRHSSGQTNLSTDRKVILKDKLKAKINHE